MQNIRYNGFSDDAHLGRRGAGFHQRRAMNEMEALAAKLPPGFAFEWTGLSREERLAGAQAFILLAFALLAVFLCIGRALRELVGYMDVGSKKFSYVKWGATGGSIGMLTLSMTFYLIASNSSATLEARALQSGDDSCAGGAPCDVYDDELKAIEDAGRRQETISKVTFTLGIAAGAVAGYWWYKEIKARKKAERALTTARTVRGLDSIVAVPVASDDYFGAAAALRF